MVEHQITCINKPNRDSRSEAITHIGSHHNHIRWTRQKAITMIESKEAAFYTVDKTTGKKADIGVVRETGKVPYVRTHADGKWNDNLLALPECDGSCRIVG